MYTVNKDEEYFLSRNTHHHSNQWCLVPRSMEDDWYKYLQADENSELSWARPAYAIPWTETLPTLTFSNPHGGPILKS